MAGPSARLLRLLSLLQARRFWSGEDLASRLEITKRTVRRDVDRLRSLGYPVDSSVGVAGGYQLGVGATLPPLLLDDDEAVAVSLGLQTMAAGSVSGIEESALRAFAKVERVLPARVRKRVAALRTAVASLQFSAHQVRAEVLTGLASASREQVRVFFRYIDRTGTKSVRKVDPHGLVHAGGLWYLVAWDRVREDWRTFRLDRIEGDLKTGDRFSAREVPGGDAAMYVARAATSQSEVGARVLIHASSDSVARQAPALANRLRPISKNRCELGWSGSSLMTLSLHLIALGEDFEVKQPPELVDMLRTIGHRVTQATKKRSRRGRS